MPFSSTASIISTDLDNMVRGLYRDNSDHAASGVGETDCASTIITGGTIGPSGFLHIRAFGKTTLNNGSKAIRLYLGSQGLYRFDVPANAAEQDWYIDGYLFNVSNSTQRYSVVSGYATAVTAGNQVTTGTFFASPYGAVSVDTSVNQTLKVTIQMASGSDTATQTGFNVFVCQMQ